MRRFGLGGAIAIAALMFGCASDQRAMVSGADMGGLRGDELAPMDSAIHEQQLARQGKAEAERRLAQSQHDLAIAKPGVDSANAAIDQAKANLDRVKDSGDPNAIHAGEHQLAIANGYKREEQTRVDFFTDDVAARQADLDTANQRLDLADAEYQKAELNALREANNPAANKYQGWRFDRAVSDRSQDVAKAETNSQDARDKARMSFDNWQVARNQYAELQGLMPARGTAPVAPPKVTPPQIPTPQPKVQPPPPVQGPAPDMEPDLHR